LLGPDGKSLYIAHGNSTPLVEGIDPNSAYRNYAEDILIPRVMDPVATFFDKLKIPYGHVLKTDENGAKWESIAGGFRNHYDMDFNADGELFTYDSDMEWDAGLPWYRPTRVLHVVPGAEYGFREGNQKWPEYYEDSLPAGGRCRFWLPHRCKIRHCFQISREVSTGVLYYGLDVRAPACRAFEAQGLILHSHQPA
jgi:hypothetical protein